MPLGEHCADTWALVLREKIAIRLGTPAKVEPLLQDHGRSGHLLLGTRGRAPPRHRVPTIRTGPHPLRTTSLTTNPSTHGNCKEIPDRPEEACRLQTRIEACRSLSQLAR